MGKIKHIKTSQRTEIQEKLHNIPYDKVLFVAIDPAKYSPKVLISLSKYFYLKGQALKVSKEL